MDEIRKQLEYEKKKLTPPQHMNPENKIQYFCKQFARLLIIKSTLNSTLNSTELKEIPGEKQVKARISWP